MVAPSEAGTFNQEGKDPPKPVPFHSVDGDVAVSTLGHALKKTRILVTNATPNGF